MSKNIAEVIKLTEERFKSIAPTNISYEAEQGFAMQLLTNNSYLMKVAEGNKASLAQAITNVAAIGLSLNPAEKQAYLIPRTVKIDDEYVSKVFLEPSYMGLCKLATDSGSIEWVQANCVRENDTFQDNGPGERPTHMYNAFSKARGEFVGVYCVAKTHTGDFLTTVMDSDDVYGIRDRSEAWKKGKFGPWATDFNEQAKKTVVRRGFKMWPRTNLNRMAEAVNISNENEGFEPILTSPKITEFTGEQKTYYDQLIEQSDGLGMLALRESIEETVWNNLYHSFQKGTKGKYQQIVNALTLSGENLLVDITTAIQDGLTERDDAKVKELIEDVSDDVYTLITNKFDDEQAQEINAIRES